MRRHSCVSLLIRLSAIQPHTQWDDCDKARLSVYAAVELRVNYVFSKICHNIPMAYVCFLVCVCVDPEPWTLYNTVSDGTANLGEFDVPSVFYSISVTVVTHLTFISSQSAIIYESKKYNWLWCLLLWWHSFVQVISMPEAPEAREQKLNQILAWSLKWKQEGESFLERWRARGKEDFISHSATLMTIRSDASTTNLVRSDRSLASDVTLAPESTTIRSDASTSGSCRVVLRLTWESFLGIWES